MNIPFEIGKTYWKPRLTPILQKVTCNVCYGKLHVIVILGNDEQITTPCDGCRRGYDAPLGYYEEYTYEPTIYEFTIKDIVSFDNRSGDEPEWRVISTTGEESEWNDLYSSKDEALATSCRRLKEFQENNYNSHNHKRQYSIQKATWHAHYHRDQISKLEKELVYHKNKVQQLKEIENVSTK